MTAADHPDTAIAFASPPSAGLFGQKVEPAINFSD